MRLDNGYTLLVRRTPATPSLGAAGRCYMSRAPRRRPQTEGGAGSVQGCLSNRSKVVEIGVSRRPAPPGAAGRVMIVGRVPGLMFDHRKLLVRLTTSSRRSMKIEYRTFTAQNTGQAVAEGPEGEKKRTPDQTGFEG